MTTIELATAAAARAIPLCAPGVSWQVKLPLSVVGAAAAWYALRTRAPILSQIRRNLRSSAPFVGRDSVVLLTGATCAHGIGVQLALLYHERIEATKSDEDAKASGAVGRTKLILVGRKSLDDLLSECSGSDGGDSTPVRMERMLRADTTLYVQVDLADKDCGAKLASELHRNRVKNIDVVVQLHGIGWVGPFAKQSEQSVNNMVNVNLRSTVLCSKHLFPFLGLKRGADAAPATEPGGWEDAPKQKTAKLVYISSIVSQRATPAFACYTATKAAVDHFAWSMLTELCDTNVGVQLMHVGATDTRFFSKCGLPDGAFDTSKFATPAQMAASLSDRIDHSRNFRHTFGSWSEQAQFYLAWLLPEQWWRRHKLRSYFSGGRYNGGCGGFVGASRAGTGEPLRCVVTGGSQGIGEAICQEIVENVYGSGSKLDSGGGGSGGGSGSGSANGDANGVRVLSLDLKPPVEKHAKVAHATVDLSIADSTDSGAKGGAAAGAGGATGGGKGTLITTLERALTDTAGFGADKPVDLLVNNAGVNFSGRLTDPQGVSDSQLSLMIAVNVTAPLVLSLGIIDWNARIAAAFKASDASSSNSSGNNGDDRNVGRPPSLVFVSSASHYFSYPGSAAYGATKDALASYAKSIGFAMAGLSSVLTVYPGPTDTSQAASASPHTGEREAAVRKSRRSPKATAAEIWKAVRDGDVAVVPGPVFKGMAVKASLDPEWAQRMMKAWQLDPMDANRDSKEGE
eukprot:CAMPEP_0117474310 /NCGR_PEP_ID=MMETSP0784-20121206/9219_1 /TAXON_ID=39447 /ORGANISM="" /LENGTH=741 /DNA_ID=CAMNT_0005268533 /DNA_START=59 /DNA_END=2284 /DNA_ORIENTATION=-